MGLGVELGSCTGPPSWAQDLRNSHSLSLSFSKELYPLGAIPHTLEKRWSKERERRVLGQERERYHKKTRIKKGRESRELSLDLVLVPLPRLKNSGIFIPFTLHCPHAPPPLGSYPTPWPKEGQTREREDCEERERETIKKPEEKRVERVERKG